jgi:imidazolonepropionase-like amidohydrolase
MGGAPDARNDSIQKQLFLRSVNVVGDLHRVGVNILAGTDTPNPYTYPGFSLHDELELFVGAGLSPMEALQSATRNPAAFLGRTKDSGTIERGKYADMVLLDGNPLDDIANTRKVSAVFLKGRPLLKTELEHLLSERAASEAK